MDWGVTLDGLGDYVEWIRGLCGSKPSDSERFRAIRYDSVRFGTKIAAVGFVPWDLVGVVTKTL